MQPAISWIADVEDRVAQHSVCFSRPWCICNSSNDLTKRKIPWVWRLHFCAQFSQLSEMWVIDLVVIRWTADQVDDHLRKLGELRTKMKPPHPRNFALGQVVRGIANAPWATETDTMLGNSILHIRDPRYGWLHFLFSKEDARKLATLLQKQVDSPRPGQGRKPS